MTILFQDVRYAVRMLRKSPAFAIVVALSLGLGIGVNATIFSFVNAVIFRPPAVEKPGQLVEVWHHVRTGSGFNSYLPLTFPDFDYYRVNNHVFSGMIGFESEFGSVSWSHGEQSEDLQGQLISGNYFSVLGVNAALGRTITAQDDRVPGASPVVVLRHALWQQRFASDPNIVGKELKLNGLKFTVIGVAAQKFDGMLVGFAPDFWTPISMYREMKPTRTDLLETRNTSWLMAVGRLREGVNLAQANSELGLLGQHLAVEHPKTNQYLTAVVVPADLTPAPMRGLLTGISALLMVIVGLVLLIACANITNLSLAQAVRRQGELAVRSALGASRWRVMQQMLTESILLACAGGAVGVLIAFTGAPLLLALKPSFLPISVDVSADWRVLSFTLGLSVATGIAVGIAPALRSTKTRTIMGFNLTSNANSYSKSRLRNFLVVSQVAFGLLLLIVAGLCVRSLRNARSVDPGFETDHALMASFDLATAGYDQKRGEGFERQLQELITRVVFDQSVFVKQAIETLLDEGAIGLFLTSIMILVFLQSGKKAKVVEHGRAQQQRHVANDDDGVFHQLLDLRGLRFQQGRFLITNQQRQIRHFEENSGERLADFVVQFAGNGFSLCFLSLNEASRELLQYFASVGNFAIPRGGFLFEREDLADAERGQQQSEADSQADGDRQTPTILPIGSGRAQFVRAEAGGRHRSDLIGDGQHRCPAREHFITQKSVPGSLPFLRAPFEHRRDRGPVFVPFTKQSIERRSLVWLQQGLIDRAESRPLRSGR